MGVSGIGLEVVAGPETELGAFDLRVRVRASGLNRADLLQSLGRYPAPAWAPRDRLGLEIAGQVMERGSSVQGFQVGDRVMGLVPGGGLAEQVVLHEREALPVPPGWSWAEAGAAPEAFLTAYDALVLQGGLRPSESVLIHGVTGGVGSAASQLAAAFGARVLGTGRSREKLEACAAHLGLDEPIVAGDPPRFAEAVRRLTGGRGVDLTLDLVGGRTLAESLRAAALQGRIVLVGLLDGPAAELNLEVLLARRIRLQGTVLRSRPPEEKMALTQAARRELSPLFEASLLRPRVALELPIERFAQGFEALTALPTPGKVVLTWA